MKHTLSIPALALLALSLLACSPALETDEDVDQSVHGAVSGYGTAATGFFTLDVRNWGPLFTEMEQLGGDTVITLGSTMNETTEFNAKTSPVFIDAKIGSDHVIDRVRSRLKYARASNDIDRIFIVTAHSDFGQYFENSVYDVIRTSPPDPIHPNNADRLYWAILFRKNDPTAALQTWADFATHPTNRFDVVVVAGRDRSLGASYRHNLIETAKATEPEAEHGPVEVFLGPISPEYNGYQLKTSSVPLYEAMFDKWMDFYAGEFADEPGTDNPFVGMYHSFEIPLNANPQQAAIDMYARTFASFKARFPNKQTLISPYTEASLAAQGGPPTLNEVGATFNQIARQTGVDIVAPQDGRGTGKVGDFFNPSQADTPLPSPLDVCGQGTFGATYAWSTRQLFAKLRQQADALASSPWPFHADVELWANLEAFEPVDPNDPQSVCPGSGATRTTTTKPRFDSQIMHFGRFPTKIVGFEWFRDIRGSLQTEIATDIDRPIIADVSSWGGGLLVFGYNLGNTSLTMTYNGTQTATWTPNDGWVDVDYYVGKRIPKPMQVRFVPFTGTLSPASVATLTATRFGKSTHNPFVWDH